MKLPIGAILMMNDYVAMVSVELCLLAIIALLYSIRWHAKNNYSKLESIITHSNRGVLQIHQMMVALADGKTNKFTIVLDLDYASVETIAELFMAMSALYTACGGLGTLFLSTPENMNVEGKNLSRIEVEVNPGNPL